MRSHQDQNCCALGKCSNAKLFGLFVDDVVDDGEDLLFAGYGGGCDFGGFGQDFVGGVAVFESGGVDADVELCAKDALRAARAPTPASLTEAGLPWDAI